MTSPSVGVGVSPHLYFHNIKRVLAGFVLIEFYLKLVPF